MNSEETSKKNKKKVYSKPKLKSFGKISEISQTKSRGRKKDGGAFPLNQKRCLTEPNAIEEYRCLTTDDFVQNAFGHAISRVVKPGDVVLDLGTGTGIHTLFAVKAGAKRVFSVDSHPIIKTAQQIVQKNGFGDKVTFIQSRFEDLVLPEKVDVLISNLGFFGSLQNLPPAVEKFLKPSGRMIPDSLQLSFAPVEEPEFFQNNIEFWRQNHYGFDFSSIVPMASLYPHYLFLQEKHFLSEAFSTKLLSLKSTDTESGKWNMSFDIPEEKTVHGLGGWYSFFTDGEKMFSTKPPNKLHKNLWNNYILPLAEPIFSEQGLLVNGNVQFHFDADNRDAHWFWELRSSH